MAPLSTDPMVWFIADRQNPSSTLSVFTSGNLVEPLIDGKSYMQRIHDLIVATMQGDYFFFAGWRLDGDQQLVQGGGEGSRVVNVFTDAHRRGVDLRIMLSDHVWNANGKIHHFFTVTVSPHVQCIRDHRLPPYGSAHQKFASIFHDGILHAFCGGIDLAVERWDDPSHAAGGWHDVHCYVQGPACRDLDITFRERWNDPRPPRKFEPAPPQITGPLPTPTTAGPHHVQILRTYACNNGYPFAPQGEFTGRRACLQTIALARDYIYMEDQFFVAYEVADALRAALLAQPSLRVIVVVPETPKTPLNRSFNFHQVVLMYKLTTAAPDRFAIYHLKNRHPDHSGKQIYIHSKTMIVDDVWVKIGSMNLCRRDMAYDPQVDVAIVDSTIVDGVCKFARDLRLQLWAEHLALPASDPSLVDPMTGFNQWKMRAGTTGVPAEPHTDPYPHGWETHWDIAEPQKLCPGAPRIPP